MSSQLAFSRRKVDPISASVAELVTFLTEKFQSGCAPSTLTDYRTANAKTLLYISGVDLGEDRLLSALLRNFYTDGSCYW
jgi:hypothetical protein